ncbi:MULTISPECIES: amidohydrolase [unclassified Sphingopyxis]|uniref:amidohydrolase n=1 Tax=unclassified Sphingopyxis TaxID=2614943 RepID=UPI002863CC71|nr:MULTISPECIES: amidohydrolase [unclassified Sphingopyxis]MDR7061678.1 putative amidohydrolase YtcJ [Sphingopyxis sp. BE235]MDR7182377.1 putative amidohydrolase YtcJ [Sphingopyxis sp. BE249]
MKFIAAAIALLLATTAPATAQDTTLYRGGPIVTMDGDTPQTVEAVVTRGDRIAFAGPEKQARKAAGKDAAIRDLKGATLLPGFIDAHSHFTLATMMAGGLDLRDGGGPPVADIAGLQAAIRDHIAARALPKGGWVVVWQYDHETLAEKRHITRAELDAVASDRPIVVFHVSLHGAVANSAALAAAGIDESTPVPPGAMILRDDRGKLNGVLLEKAMFILLAKLPQPSAEQKLAALDAAQNRYFAEGYTHAQDGATQRADLAFLTSPAARERLKIDLALLPIYTELDALLAGPDRKFGVYQDHVKLQGIKFILDGSVQARTGYFTRDYARGSPAGDHPWHGHPGMSDAEFQGLARKAHDRGWQLFVHANGDAAIDMAIKGFDALGIKAADNRRPIVIHSQFQRRDQLAAYKRIGVGPAYFSNHAWYWADVHRTNFPAEVVDFISPFRSARAAGLIASNHSDYSVTPLDTRFMLWTSMARVSPTGVVSGPEERLNAYEALQALTTGPAWQAFEEDRKGRIKAGLLADFVILDKNPLTTPVDDIKSIKVRETIKEGRSVWRANF